MVMKITHPEEVIFQEEEKDQKDKGNYSTLIVCIKTADAVTRYYSYLKVLV